MSTKITPTYKGYIASTKDALIVIQAALNNQLPTIPKRPHDKTRAQLINSGNVFVFVEERSGVKRWTDGVSWSPSRILGRFLIYRELDGALADKDKKKRKELRRKHSNNSSPQQQNETPSRSLVGSLVASYAFKDSGLVKKTMSLTIPRLAADGMSGSETVHLISYYNTDDVMAHVLSKPSEDPSLRDVHVSPELWGAVRESSLGGKMPVEDETYYYLENGNSAHGSSGSSGAISYFNSMPQNSHGHHVSSSTFLPPLAHLDASGAALGNPASIIGNPSASLGYPLPQSKPVYASNPMFGYQQQQQQQQQAKLGHLRSGNSNYLASPSQFQSLLPPPAKNPANQYFNGFMGQPQLNNRLFYSQNGSQLDDNSLLSSGYASSSLYPSN